MVDNLIRLFDSEERSFETNGVGALMDAESCLVTEERNGIFELELVYPIDGQHYNDISLRSLIVVKSNPYSDPQPFRVYEISKPINGRVTINAAHISYDLSGYPVSPFSMNGTTADVLNKIKESCPIECPFDFWTNKNIEMKKDYSVVVPCSIRSLLCGSDGSLTDVFGKGEYEFDGFHVKLWLNRGENSGVTIQYGKNLIDIKQEENCESVYTGVYPYWYSEADNIRVTLPEGEEIVSVNNEYMFKRILPLDLSDKFGTKPSQDDLRKAAEDYISNNDITTPKVSIEVSFEQLSKTTDYKDFEDLEAVRLCDTVSIEFFKLGVSATAKCIKTVYDVLTDRYSKVELGDAKNNLANTLSQQGKAIESSPNRSYVDQAIETATKAITGNLGGNVIIHSSNGGKYPDEILIMDTDDIQTAQYVWRWNMAGLGFSGNGYGGNYGTAITQDGQIVADFIKVGTLRAIAIESAPKEVEGEEKILFSVDKYGKLIAQDCDITGTITANAGTIGGCEIQNGVLKVKAVNIDEKLTAESIDASELKVSAANITGTLKVEQLEVNGKLILKGEAVTDQSGESDTSFLVDENGTLTANNCFIGGTIYANAGQIAGLIIERQTETVNGLTRNSRVFRSPDSDNNPAFEIRVIDEGNDRYSSSINITKLSGETAEFSGDVTVQGTLSALTSIKTAGVTLSGFGLYVDNKILIDFGVYRYGESDMNTASLAFNKNSTHVKIQTQKNLSERKEFTFRLRDAWSGAWTDIKSLTIKAGDKVAEGDFTDSKWGYSDGYFVVSGAKSYAFSEAFGDVRFGKNIEPATSSLNIGSRNRAWSYIWAGTLCVESIKFNGGTTDLVEDHLNEIYGWLSDLETRVTALEK